MPSQAQVNEVIHATWLRGALAWKLWPQQEPIYYGIRALRGVEEAVVLCARQFGKSHLGALLAIEDCLRHPEKCILIIGPTIKQTIDIVAPRIRDITKDAPPGLITRSKSESKWYIGKSELVIGGFDLSSSSQRGKTVQNIYIEEIVDANPDDYVEAMRSDLGPSLTHSDGGKLVFITTPPKIPDHPFVIDTLARAQLNGALYTYTIEDNDQLSEEQYDACVRRAGGKHTVDFRREYMCEIVRDASIVVVPDFDSLRHTLPVPRSRYANGQVTIDWGGVRDLTVALLHWYDYQTDKFYVWDERWFPANTTTEVIIPEVRRMEAGVPEGVTIKDRRVDVPGPLLTDLTITHKYECAMVNKDDWQANINNLALGFTLNRIQVDPRCPLTIQTLKSGTFNKQRTDFMRTIALGHCDALAALMYGYRSQARDNPYPKQTGGDWSYVPPEKNPDDIFAGAIQPKSFGGAKRFGAFR